MRGVITEVEQHPEWKLWSFKLSGSNTWFRAGKFFKNKAGDSIEFDTEVVGKNTKASNIRYWKEESTQTSVPAAAVAKAGPAQSSADYWAAREARDVETQKRIELQSCRNSAIEFVKLATAEAVGAIKLPAKPADKARVVEELVAHYTDVFLKENKAGGPGSGQAIEDSVKADSAAEESLVDKKKEPESTDDNDNWN